MFSHAQIWPQGACKQLRKVNVVGGGGGGGMRANTITTGAAWSSPPSSHAEVAVLYLYPGPVDCQFHG